jgi:colicin import membrane protein
LNTTALNRDPFMPRTPKGRGPALVLALVAHVLLIAGLAFGVHWRNSEPTTIAAELWSAVPQAAAPRAVEPPPTPQPEAKKPAPVVKPAEPPTPPKPAPQPQPDPQIAIEKAKQEKVRQDKADKLEAEREKAEQQRAKEEQAQKKAAADKLKADKDKEKEKTEKADAARQEAIRNANLKRIQGMAGATGEATDTGTALRSSGPSATYAGRVMARVKPNILLTDQIDGNPKAVVDVKLAPDGTIISRRLSQSSGVKVWDDAVLRAIDRTEVLPRDVDGTVPSQMEIGFRPRD